MALPTLPTLSLTYQTKKTFRQALRSPQESKESDWPCAIITNSMEPQEAETIRQIAIRFRIQSHYIYKIESTERKSRAESRPETAIAIASRKKPLLSDG